MMITEWMSKEYVVGTYKEHDRRKENGRRKAENTNYMGNGKGRRSHGKATKDGTGEGLKGYERNEQRGSEANRIRVSRGL